MIIAVGSNEHGHTELYSVRENAWKQVADYPFQPQRSAAPVLTYGENFIVFGRGAVIALFDLSTQQWSRIGSTTYSNRYHHNAIQLENGDIMVFGGTGEFGTDLCTWNEGTLQCERQNPFVNRYTAWPEMFYVTNDFCQ